MTPRRPGPMLRRILRTPTRLYDWHLGWIFRAKIPAADPYGPHSRAPVSDDARGRRGEPGSSRGGRPRRPWTLGAVVSQPSRRLRYRGRSRPGAIRSLVPRAGSGRGSCRTGPVRAAQPAYSTGHQSSAQLARRLALRRDPCQAAAARERTADDRATAETEPAGPRGDLESRRPTVRRTVPRGAGDARLGVAGSWCPFQPRLTRLSTNTRNSFERAWLAP